MSPTPSLGPFWNACSWGPQQKSWCQADGALFSLISVTYQLCDLLILIQLSQCL